MTRKIKVLQLCAVGFTIKNFLRPLINFLQEKDCDVTVCCAPDGYEDELQGAPFDFHPIAIERSMNVFAHLRAAANLKKYLEREKFDIVHTHTPIASLIGRMAAKQAHVPIILYTAHGFYFHDDMPTLKRSLHIALERWGGKRTDFLFTQSDEDRRTAIAKGIIASDKILTIGNGIDMERFDPAKISADVLAEKRTELGIPEDVPVIGIIGRLVREKGYVELFQAGRIVSAKIPDVHFLVIGSALKSDHDAAREEIDTAIKRTGLADRVHFAGLRTDVPELLSLCTVYTLPSWREGMPRSIIEAMAMERPVVATNIRGCREEVIEGETGYLVPVRDAVSLGAALLKVLENPDEGRRMGIAGRKRALERFDERLVLQRQWEVYEKLLKAKDLGE
jgi:glycosyltransferase involved in cell wall biosynthesis